MLQAIFLWPHWIEPSTLILLLYALLMSHACSHADPSLSHIGVFVTMLVVLSHWYWLDFFASFLMQLFDVFIIIVVWVLLFFHILLCFLISSGILVHSVTELYIELLVHCAACTLFLSSSALDGGVRCFWWWRDNNATLHFSYLICFLIHDNRVFVMTRTRPAIFSRRMCRNFRLHASTALSRQCRATIIPA